MAIVYGTSSSETINAADGVTEYADTIYGYAGNDTIFGLGGNDFIIGGLGNDTINGGGGSDTAFYTDSATGVTVNLATGNGFYGTAQGDTLISIENLWGSNFNDTLMGNDADNSLSGLDGKDTLKGGGGADVLNGGDGDDMLLGGAGGDTIYGGSGNDTVSYITSTEYVYAFLHGQYENFGGDAEGDSFNGVENLTGSNYNDRLDGDKYANVLAGAGGNDTLDGRGGADTMIGGKGNDTMYVENADDIIIEAVGEGDDTVATVVSYQLAAGAEVEKLVVNGESSDYDIDLTGNEFGQYLRGNEGKNIIDGGGGADTMDGWEGDDTYYVDNAGDKVIDIDSESVDTVLATTSWALTAGANVEFLQTTSVNGTTAIDLAGNETSQQVTGNMGANTLSGGFGTDTLVGYGGIDTFLFDSALDAVNNVDVIFDFNQSDDLIALDKSIFSALGTDVGHYLTGNEFTIGAAAADADDRIIYNSDTGALLYDADGVDGADAIQFATIGTGLNLVNDDFTVV